MRDSWSYLMMHKFGALMPLCIMIAFGGLIMDPAFCTAQGYSFCISHYYYYYYFGVSRPLGFLLAGFFIQLFAAADAMWNINFGIQLLVIMIWDKDLYQTWGLKFYYPLAWLYPLVSSITIVALGATGASSLKSRFTPPPLIWYPLNRILGPSGLWCWISNAYPGLRLGFLYLWPVGIALGISELATVVASIVNKVEITY